MRTLPKDMGEPGPFHDLTSPLDGYWWESDKIVCVPFVGSQKPQAFVVFLGEMEAKGKPVLFPTVVNGRLDTLLERRGYEEVLFWATAPLNEWGTGRYKATAGSP